MAGEVRDFVAASFEKAKAKIEAAKAEAEDGRYEDAVSRAYYAAYHAVTAALKIDGIEVRTHEGLKTTFGLHFVRTGKVPPELGKFLTRLKDERENGDYSVFSTIDEADAREAIQSAERIVQTMKEYARSRGMNFATE